MTENLDLQPKLGGLGNSDKKSDLKRKLGGLGDSDRESGSAAKTARPGKQYSQAWQIPMFP